MATDKQTDKFYGDEAPTAKNFLMVLVVLIILIVLSWIAYYKLHLFH